MKLGSASREPSRTPACQTARHGVCVQRGDICLTTTSTLDCLEEPSPRCVADGTTFEYQNEDGSLKEVGTVKKDICVVLQCWFTWHHVAETRLWPSLLPMLASIHKATAACHVELMHKDVMRECALTGMQLVQHSALRRGFDVQQNCSAASNANGMAFQDSQHKWNGTE